MENKIVYKWCFVPHCSNTTNSTPNKLFATVPKNESRKKQWFKAARRVVPESKSIFFCCEDHFNLESDMENYVKYKLMGGRIQMKRNAVPHIFDCQPDKRPTATVPLRSCATKRPRKELIWQAEEEFSRVDEAFSTTSNQRYKSVEHDVDFSFNNDYKDIAEVTIKEEHSYNNLLEVGSVKIEKVSLEEMEEKGSRLKSRSNSSTVDEVVEEKPCYDNLSDVGSIKIEENDVEEFIQESVKIGDSVSANKERMETRSAKRMKMTGGTKDGNVSQSLNSSYYESTIGTLSFERDIAIRDFMNQQLSPISNPSITDDISQPHYDSGSDFVAYSSSDETIESSSDENLYEHLNRHTVIEEQPHNIVYKNKQEQSKKVVSLRPESLAFEDDDEDFQNERTENVNIKAAQKLNGKIVRDKRHSCYFCHQIVINNVSRHFENNHKDEVEVAKILAKPKNSKERRDAFINLTRCGDFYHNCSTLETKKGELILSRRPSENEIKRSSYTDYGPCPECLGFMLRKHIWHHLKYSCKMKETEDTDCQNRKIPTAESRALLTGILGTNVTAEFTSNIINKFKNDDVAGVCKEDSTIIKYGAFLYEKYDITQSELIRQSMRQLGRLSIELKKLDKNFKFLKEFLVPEKFDVVVNATKHLCIATKEISKIPSLALKIGYALRKCIAIERGHALRQGDLKSDENFVSFLNLLDLEWSVKISSNAIQILYIKTETPTNLSDELVKLSNYINKEIKTIKSNTCNMNIRNHVNRKYLGKELNDMNIEDLPSIENNEEDNDDDNGNEAEGYKEDDEEITVTGIRQTKNSQKKSKGILLNKRRDSNGGKRDYTGRKVWSRDEKEILLEEFRALIKLKSLPGKEKCLTVIENNPGIFVNRKWTDLKFYIKNYLTKINKTNTF